LITFNNISAKKENVNTFGDFFRLLSFQPAATMRQSLQNGCFAETTLSFLVGEQGLMEFILIEIGPKGGGHIDLAVRHLPQQKITQAHLAAGADQ
jgi:hypothetical protein